MTVHAPLRRQKAFDLDAASYTPGRLIDKLFDRLQVRNDSELSVKLNIDHGVISKIRRRKLNITPHVIVRILDATDLSIKELRQLAGLPSELDL